MRVKHLKENEMQAYVEGTLEAIGWEAEDHIKWCADCSQAVDDYRAIVSTLEVDDIPRLQEGFPERVMVKLKEHLALRTVVQRSSGLDRDTVLSLVSGGILGVLMTLYYSGLSTFSKVCELLSLQFSQIAGSVVESMSGIVAKSGLKPELLLFVCLLLLLFSILDKQLTRARRSRINLHTL